MKQNSHLLAHRRTRGGSRTIPMAIPSGRSISNTRFSPSGVDTSSTSSSSAVRNSQSRKSSSFRPFTAESTVPGRMPSSDATVSGRTRATLIIDTRGLDAQKATVGRGARSEARNAVRGCLRPYCNLRDHESEIKAEHERRLLGSSRLHRTKKARRVLRGGPHFVESETTSGNRVVPVCNDAGSVARHGERL